ncbi:hypothetical protein [Ferrimonas balearica]|uniref:hypothetical protein n=1 Tax=Ferrimonas balearica TaxID=44012 RepID=UPI001C9975FD|nr:hypothetical protein [Ferrimonas balearica]MBY5991209.1 hypothetical protein [Ferrimonas balearica]
MAPERTPWLERPGSVQKILYGLYACCAVLLALDFVIHRHVEHAFERLWGFYPLYGFVGCVVLVLIAKWMRSFLMRDEDYYDRLEGDSAKEGEDD